MLTLLSFNYCKDFCDPRVRIVRVGDLAQKLQRFEPLFRRLLEPILRLANIVVQSNDR